MGANGFTIAYKERIRFGNDNQTERSEKGKTQKVEPDKPIQLREVEMFKASFKYPALLVLL